MYDLIIIGAGPGGMTAAIYAARKRLKTLIVTENVGGQMALSSSIENYVGFQVISGLDLSMKFEEHVNKYEIDFNTSQSVTKIEKISTFFKVSTADNSFLGKSIIITSGKIPKKLNVPGEDDFKNKGVTYCTTCDGPLFAGKDVAVIGGGNSALDAVLQMMKICPKVYLINQGDELIADSILVEKAQKSKVVEIINNAQVKEIKGNNFVDEIILEYKQKSKSIPISGVFIEIGLLPNSDFGINLKKNNANEIIIDEQNQTSIPGIFAAGDVTNAHGKQIIIAAGEGCKACLSVGKYLNNLIIENGINPNSKFVCDICHYEYDPSKNKNTPFANLPEDWTCPVCGAAKEHFFFI